MKFKRLILDASLCSLIILLLLPFSVTAQPIDGEGNVDERERARIHLLIIKAYEDELGRSPDFKGLSTHEDYLLNQGKDEKWLREALRDSKEGQQYRKEKLLKIFRWTGLSILLFIFLFNFKRFKKWLIDFVNRHPYLFAWCRKIILISGLIVMLLLSFYYFSRGFVVHRVAHAGGGIDNKTYTNSIDALNANIRKGFKYFELDFSFTSDGHLVCLHDWGPSFERSFGFKTDQKVTLEKFNHLIDTAKYKKCTIYSLSDWMELYTQAVIVTDVKEDNLKALRIILEKVPNAKTRIIPQIYNPKNYTLVKEMGFEQIIWTLYTFKGTNEEVLAWVEKFNGAFAVTMPTSRAKSNLPKKLMEKNIPTYVHTINSLQEAENYINRLGISEIYTDFLAPKE